MGDSSGANISAALRVCEKLRRPLSALAGATGFRALLSRALALAKARDPGLSAVQVKPDGSLEGLSEVHDGVLLIGQLLGLLGTFVGESLTLRLIQDAWPDLALNNSNSVETKSIWPKIE